MRFFVIDDDLASRKMLIRIILDEDLGEVIGEVQDAVGIEREILHLQPDIVLIDLLMPNQDGIETVSHLRQRQYKGKIVMISQVENKEMVAKAYQEGIEYFIHKPINRVEVSSVLSKVIEQIKMEQSLQKIKESLHSIEPLEVKRTVTNEMSTSPSLQKIFSDLGIQGEGGVGDIVSIMQFFYKTFDGKPIVNESMNLTKLFIEVLKLNGKSAKEKEIKALEQRLRRTANQAMTNLASLGLVDYAHPTFEHYATSFFDFHEIRLKMNELERKQGKKAKVNLRKFLYAMYHELLR